MILAFVSERRQTGAPYGQPAKPIERQLAPVGLCKFWICRRDRSAIRWGWIPSHREPLRLSSSREMLRKDVRLSDVERLLQLPGRNDPSEQARRIVFLEQVMGVDP